MAAITGATTATSVEEIVPQEDIDTYVQEINAWPLTAWAICNPKPIAPGRGKVLKLPKWAGGATPAGVKTETDEFTVVEVTTTEESVTVSYVGLAVDISDEAQHDSIIAALRASTADVAVQQLRQRIDSDGLALFKSASDTANYAGSKFQSDRFRSALTQFLALKPRGARRVFVMSLNMADSFAASIEGASGAVFGSDARSAELLSRYGEESGFMGVYRGVELFRTGNVGTTSTDANGGFAVAGDKVGALVYAVAEPINIELDRFAKRKTDEAVISARYGWAIGNQASLLEVVADNS